MKKILLSVLILVLVIVAGYFIILKINDYSVLKNDQKTVQFVKQAIVYINGFYNLNHKFPADNTDWESGFIKQNNFSYPLPGRLLYSTYDKSPTENGFSLIYDLSKQRDFAVGAFSNGSTMVGIPILLDHPKTIAKYNITDQDYKNYLPK